MIVAGKQLCQPGCIIYLSLSNSLWLIGLCTLVSDWRGGGCSGTSLWKNTLVWMIGCDWQRNQLPPRTPAMCCTPQQKRNCRSLRWNGHHTNIIPAFLPENTWPQKWKSQCQFSGWENPGKHFDIVCSKGGYPNACKHYSVLLRA